MPNLNVTSVEMFRIHCVLPHAGHFLATIKCILNIPPVTRDCVAICLISLPPIGLQAQTGQTCVYIVHCCVTHTYQCLAHGGTVYPASRGRRRYAHILQSRLGRYAHCFICIMLAKPCSHVHMARPNAKGAGKLNSQTGSSLCKIARKLHGNSQTVAGPGFLAESLQRCSEKRTREGWCMLCGSYKHGLC